MTKETTRTLIAFCVPNFLALAGIALGAVINSCVPPSEPTEPTSSSTTSSTSDSGGAGGTNGPTETSATGGPTLEQQCKDVCDAYKADDCIQAVAVCAPDGFDEEGECVKLLPCEQACEAEPGHYLPKDCER